MQTNRRGRGNLSLISCIYQFIINQPFVYVRVINLKLFLRFCAISRIPSCPSPLLLTIVAHTFHPFPVKIVRWQPLRSSMQWAMANLTCFAAALSCLFCNGCAVCFRQLQSCIYFVSWRAAGSRRLSYSADQSIPKLSSWSSRQPQSWLIRQSQPSYI